MPRGGSGGLRLPPKRGPGGLRCQDSPGGTLALQLGGIAPDFQADTSEFGEVSRRRADFTARGVEVIGLSIDSVGDHTRWAQNIEDPQGVARDFPLIGDPDRKLAGLYDMIHPSANNTLTVRSVLIIVLALSNEEATWKFPDGWGEQKPYLRLVKLPNESWVAGGSAAQVPACLAQTTSRSARRSCRFGGVPSTAGGARRQPVLSPPP